MAWQIVRTVLVALVVLALAHVAYRALVVRRRRLRRWVRFALVQNDADIGRSGSLTDTWDELIEALQRRWWERALGGVKLARRS